MEQIGNPFYFGEECFKINAPEDLVPTMEAAIKSLIPNATFGGGRIVKANYTLNQDGLQVSVTLEGEKPWSLVDLEILDPRYNALDSERRLKERIRLGIQKVLEKAYNLKASPWGILTGVRPTKLVHSLFDRGFSREELKRILLDIYGLKPEKIELLLEVAARQRSYFNSQPNNPIGIYVGIPFCPTRCSYCSFAAYPMASHGHLLQDFLEALKLEIEAIGTLIRELDLQVETVYLGGGTPTTVQGADLELLLDLIKSHLCTLETKEFTVEAGRPETLSLETLQILKDGGTGRISINPQTMHAPTLDAIGRNHSVAEVRTAFRLARQVGISSINMDIILGLPGEELEHVEKTLKEIGALKPDNLTVHSLALKRASRLKKSLKDVKIAQEQGEAMVNLARNYALSWGMVPYYLYRQRHILGDLENIGYAKPQHNSIYNIQMMEERQTIIALGGGGITKLVSGDLTLVRHANPKCPATYSQQIKTNLDEKLSRLREHFKVRID